MDALRLTLAPNVVLEPTVSDELLPTDEFLFTLVPLMDSSSTPETNAGNSTDCACAVPTRTKEVSEAMESVLKRFSIFRGD